MVSKVDCILCSIKDLDYLGYTRHLSNFHQVKAGEDSLLALQFLKEKDRLSLIRQTKTEVIKFKENEEAQTSQGQAKPGQRETTIEELVEAREVEKPKNKHLQVGGHQFRKRKSMVVIRNDAVSSKVKMFSQVVNNSTSTSTPAPITTSRTKTLTRTGSNSVSTQKLLTEKKPEALVKEILMKTLEEHRRGQKTADDTISCFDEIFATNCPSDLDESFDEKVEGPFKMLLEEEEEFEQPEEETPQEDESTRKIQDQDEENWKTVEVEKEEIEGEMKESEEEIGAEEFGEEARYSCDSCGKRFKFLTYLKGHQSSKANCNSKEIKKKRQSMNVSRLGTF